MSITTRPVVSILVVNYNTREMTRACLDSVVRECSNIDYELILVDNDSSDGSAAALAAHPAVSRLLALTENIGFARANNLAAGHATGRFILLLNPDTVVLDRAIERLVRFAGCCPDAGIWGGRTVFADGRLNPSSCWGRMTVWNQFCRITGLTGLFRSSPLFNGEAYGNWQRDNVRSVDIVSGCFFLIERDFWRRLGGFDSAFFMYGEEADLCLRAQALGARPMLSPVATILHYGGASERSRAGKLIKLLAAKMTLIDRHFSPAARPIARLLLAGWPLTRWWAAALRAHLAPANSGHSATAAAWRETWQARARWWQGYAARRQHASSLFSRLSHRASKAPREPAHQSSVNAAGPSI
ncbi:MAG: glycosyltransferase family 2 protein [Hyphomicrobiaceae bacterium]|nr:glycosyltransferase family 2 protein [Hyphomicrobiaceae bacterium]